MRPLLVGQCPSASGPPAPLEGRIGLRLAELAGVDLAHYLAHTDRVNVWPTPVAANAWPEAEVKARAEKIVEGRFFEGRVIVLFGELVATAFGVDFDPDVLTTPHHGPRRTRIYVLPHPSGRNRWWNDAANVARAAEIARRIWGEEPTA
jgi:uracil-DNA glycosylase